MNTTLSSYNEARRSLQGIVDAVPAGRWRNPSPCDGWVAQDVLRHIIDTQREFLSGRGLDMGETTEDDDPAAAWRSHSQRVEHLLEDEAVVAAEYEGFFGPTTTGKTLEQFYIWDMLVHRWDIATAAALDAQLTDAELDTIESGADAFGAGLYMEGICKPGVNAGVDDDRQAHALAKLGRRA